MSGCKLPHKRLTVKQSAQLQRMIDELRPVTERAAGAIYVFSNIVDGKRSLATGEIENVVYEICPDALAQIAPTLRTVAEMYEEMARYCGVETTVAKWEPGAKG